MMTDIVIDSEKARKEAVQLLSKQIEDSNKLLLELGGDENTEPFVIQDDEDLEFAMKLLLHVKKQKKLREERKNSVVKPLNEVLKTIRSWFSDIAHWERAEKLLKGKIQDYKLLESQREDEAIAQIAEAAKEQDYDKAHQASLVINKEAKKVQGVTTSERWVLDEANVDLEKAPKEFLIISLNRAVVREYIKQFDKGRPADLPGLPFKKDITVTGSTKGG